MTRTRPVELRCAWGFHDGALTLDAELLVEVGEGEALTSTVLCRGAPVLERRSDASGFGPPARAFLTGRMAEPDRWEYHPARLPDADVARAWGDFVAARLETGIGGEVLDELFGPGNRDGPWARLVFTARDARTAQIPVETVRWPRSGDLLALRSSVVRTPDRLLHTDVPTLWARDIGRYASLVLEAPGAGAEQLLADLPGVIAGVAGRGSRGNWIAAPRRHELAELDDPLVALARRTDLLAVCGHANVDAGLSVGSDGRSLAGERLAETLLGSYGASVVILAMCGSAVREDPGRLGAQPSIAEAFARRGAGIVVGFQGTRVDPAMVSTFARTLLGTVAPALLHCESRACALPAWESAVVAARRAVDETVAPVVHVHPGLLAGRAGRPMAAGRLHASRVPVALRSTPFYVPGQVVVADAGEAFGLLRLPLPVDVGRRLDIELTFDGRSPASHGTTLAADDLKRLAELWGFAPGLAIRVTASGAPVPPYWAAQSAELSAVIRAVSVAADRRRIPDAVLGWLDAAVASDRGAHDAAPRLVAAGGRRAAHLGTWPALWVETRDFDETPLGPSGEPPAFERSIESIVTLFDAGAETLAELAAGYARHFGAHANGAFELAHHARRGACVMPAAANLRAHRPEVGEWLAVGPAARPDAVEDTLTY